MRQQHTDDTCENTCKNSRHGGSGGFVSNSKRMPQKSCKPLPASNSFSHWKMLPRWHPILIGIVITPTLLNETCMLSFSMHLSIIVKILLRVFFIIMVIMRNVEPVMHPRLQSLDSIGIQDAHQGPEQSVNQGRVNNITWQCIRHEGIVKVSIHIFAGIQLINDHCNDTGKYGWTESFKVLQSHTMGQFQTKQRSGHGKSKESTNTSTCSCEINDTC
mmetsp:Transcript_6898/g.10191  ORF Transcript_6898/g.10191 Transcript_6898/m.10191 type:complete len:217 (+) Transcript_6898:851-1501(+)